MMRFELGLEKPDPKRARNSATVIAGVVPRRRTGSARALHVPARRRTTALLVSVVVTLIALSVFGYVKGRYTGAGPWKSAAADDDHRRPRRGRRVPDRESDYVVGRRSVTWFKPASGLSLGAHFPGDNPVWTLLASPDALPA